MNTLLKNAVCLGAATFAMHTAQAQLLLFGNATGPDTFTSSDPDGVGGSFGNGEQRAGGFTTGGTAFTLDHVAIAMAAEGANASTVSVSIYSDNAGTPDTSIFTLSASTSVTSASANTFTFGGGGFTLNAGTTYWLVVENTGGGSILWNKSDGGNGTTPTAANGSGYNNEGFQANFFGWSPTTDNGNIAVYTTAVPEPREYALIAGVGLCAFAAYRRRNLVKA
jgi:hypothetical protein